MTYQNGHSSEMSNVENSFKHELGYDRNVSIENPAHDTANAYSTLGI